MDVRVEVKRHRRCRFCRARCHVVGCIEAVPVCEGLQQYTAKEDGHMRNYCITVTVETSGKLLVQPPEFVRGSWADVVRYAEEKCAHACVVTAECL